MFSGWLCGLIFATDFSLAWNQSKKHSKKFKQPPFTFCKRNAEDKPIIHLSLKNKKKKYWGQVESTHRRQVTECHVITTVVAEGLCKANLYFIILCSRSCPWSAWSYDLTCDIWVTPTKPSLLVVGITSSLVISVLWRHPLW